MGKLPQAGLSPSPIEALGDRASGRSADGASAAAVEQLCAALVGGTPGAGLASIEALVARGVPLDDVYETFIPGAAARLGELWAEDALSFTAVTLGMARLTDAFRTLSPAFMRQRQPVRAARRALFALVPGEQHALGVVLAADYFQRAGWTMQVELQADRATLVDLVRSQPFHLVGLSAGSRRMLPALADLVGRLRAAAAPHTRFAIGGALLGLEPDLAGRLGVEVAATSAKETVYRMERAA